MTSPRSAAKAAAKTVAAGNKKAAAAKKAQRISPDVTEPAEIDPFAVDEGAGRNNRASIFGGDDE
jgi:hypothetical protein